jgi:hypothetical protein
MERKKKNVYQLHSNYTTIETDIISLLMQKDH